MKPVVLVYRIHEDNLPRATQELNGTYDYMTVRVLAVHKARQPEMFLMVVEKVGSYPFIENKWKEFFS